MKIGYVRVSTEEQNTARQEIMLRELGVDTWKKLTCAGVCEREKRGPAGAEPYDEFCAARRYGHR